MFSVQVTRTVYLVSTLAATVICSPKWKIQLFFLHSAELRRHLSSAWNQQKLAGRGQREKKRRTKDTEHFTNVSLCAHNNLVRQEFLPPFM